MKLLRFWVLWFLVLQVLNDAPKKKNRVYQTEQGLVSGKITDYISFSVNVGVYVTARQRRRWQ